MVNKIWKIRLNKDQVIQNESFKYVTISLEEDFFDILYYFNYSRFCLSKIFEIK
jgi:hypothetical protein